MALFHPFGTHDLDVAPTFLETLTPALTFLL